MIIFNLFKVEKAYSFDDMDAAYSKFIMFVNENISSRNGSHNLCLYGSDDIVSYFLSLKDGKFINLDQEFARYKDCKLIYVAKNKEKYVKTFIDNFNSSGAVTISIFESYIGKGGAIFIGVGRRNFELSVDSNILEKNLTKIDSSVKEFMVRD